MDLRQRTRRIFEDLISRGDLALADDLIGTDYTDHRGPPGRAGFVMGLQMIRGAFPDWTSTVEVAIVEGDLVAALWTVRGTHRGEFMGIPATGTAVEMQECGFLTFRDGQLVELRRVADELSLMRQLGVIPDGRP